MKLLSAFVALIATVATVEATGSHKMVRANRHANLAHRAASSSETDGSSRKCSRRHVPTSLQSSATHAAATSSAAVHKEAKASPTSSSHKASSTSAKPKETSKASSYAETSGGSSGSSGGSCSNKAAGGAYLTIKRSSTTKSTL